MDNVTAAKQLIKLLDLTALSETDTEYSIVDLCRRAQTPYGNTAAICIYSRFLSTARRELKGTDIKIATVVNFPQGGHDLKQISKETETALHDGADEIDAVFPYHDFLEGQYQHCLAFLRTMTELCEGKTLKIILETGELGNTSTIREASKMALDSNVGFIKTSTGKTKVSATYEAANIMLETINSNKYKTGFKASGGIRNTIDAKQYLILAETIMGSGWICPDKFRIGASSLLNDLLLTIKRGY